MSEAQTKKRVSTTKSKGKGKSEVLSPVPVAPVPVHEEEEEETPLEPVQVAPAPPALKKKGGKKVKEESVPVPVEVVEDDSPKKRGRRPKAKEQVYSLLTEGDGGESGGEGGVERETVETVGLGQGERLILHLPISSDEKDRREEPSAYQSAKASVGSPWMEGVAPVATYDLEGGCVHHPTSKSYRELAEEVKVEKKDYTICFQESVQDAPSDLASDYTNKIKEFKLGAFIQTIPKGANAGTSDAFCDQSARSAMTDEDYYANGMILKGVGAGARANPFQNTEEDMVAAVAAMAIPATVSVEEPNRMNKKNLRNIMVEFMNANMYQEWPDQTHIHCWWCCHPFEGPPCCLPEYMRREKFYVSGCFCTFNCAAAYNFSKNDNEMWERYTLLNLMYKRLFQTSFKKIELAPPREVLKIFGGYMSIEEFRGHCLKQEKSFQVIMPPLISIIPKIEENIHPRQGAVNEHILHKTQSKLKLTRTKPVIQEKSSIHSFMKITSILPE